MMNKVLIALDYDITAQTVAEKGFALCGGPGYTLVLLHVLDNPAYYSSTVYTPIMGFGGYVNLNLLENDLVQQLHTTSRLYLEHVKEHLGGGNITTLVTEGHPAGAIIKAAKDEAADLIVIGSHSRGWMENILMGNITEKVIRHSHIPVLLIPVSGKTEAPPSQKTNHG